MKRCYFGGVFLSKVWVWLASFKEWMIFFVAREWSGFFFWFAVWLGGFSKKWHIDAAGHFSGVQIHSRRFGAVRVDGVKSTSRRRFCKKLWSSKSFWNVNIPVLGKDSTLIWWTYWDLILKGIKNSCAPKTWTQLLPLFSPLPHCISFLMDFVVVVATAGMVQAECPDCLFRTEVSHYNIYWKHEWQKSLVGAVGSINFLATACSGNCSLLNTSYEENWIQFICRGCVFWCFL